jgi:hypothetical protein
MGSQDQSGVMKLGVQRVESCHHLGQPFFLHLRNRLIRIQAHYQQAYRHAPRRRVAVPPRKYGLLPWHS